MNQINLAQEIKKRRNILNITQEQLADMAEIGLRTLKGIENGTGNPTITTINKLAEVLGMNLKLSIKEMEL
ncbi:MAG: helix-turn-helix transcriptional regulator [Kiritimatiellae bacterium]|nr:helix-turn-helix transcriptional regulator [Kiritimatiellia bacterium]